MKPSHVSTCDSKTLCLSLACLNSRSPKKPDASEQKIRLNEERFERIIKSLSSISKQLAAQLQRKTLLLGGYQVCFHQRQLKSFRGETCQAFF